MTSIDTEGLAVDAVADVELDGESLTIEHAVAVGRADVTVSLSARARSRVEASRELRAGLIARGTPIYGVTTGFGDSAHRQITTAQTAALQSNLLRFLGCGTGPVAPHEIARTTMAIRANCLAKGHSGVRVELVERLLVLVNSDVIPVIPERGSCGASGDLVPLSYVGRTLTGESEVRHRGQRRAAKDALAQLGLEPLELEAKEGLSLVNGTSFTSAFACHVVVAAQRLADTVDLLTAITSEALLGNRGHFNEFLFHPAKPHDGIVHSAANIRRILDGSQLSLDSEELFADRELSGMLELDRQVQDRYSIRCAPHVNGVLRDTLTWVTAWLSTEINSSDDNPLFDTAAGRVQSGGNFYAGHVGQAMDALKIAVASVCDMLDRQLQLLVDEKFNGALPPNLMPRLERHHPDAGLHHGFKGMQLCSSAMTAEALKLSNPATVHSRSTEAHNQDKVSMGTIAARDARTIAEITEAVAAIHLIAAAQALEIRGVSRAGQVGKATHQLVRAHVAYLDRDRAMEGDITQAIALTRTNEFRELAKLH